jgi:AcrR family transcriptional regulator
MKGPGRRAGAPDTRSEILAAARKVFGESGYDRATVRSIAGEAGVDPSLIYHYYSTKDELFAASIEVPFPPMEVLESVFASDPDEVGRKLAETFFSIWENGEARASLLGILRSAMGGDDRAVAAFREFLTAAILDHISPLIPADRARLRALLMASQLIGVAMTRYVMRLEPVASAPIEELVELVAPRIQSYVDPTVA